MNRSFLFLIALLFTFLSCGRQPSQAPFIDTELAKLIPSDATVLLGIDLAVLKTTSFYARHRSQIDSPLLNDFAAKTGFDPRRDLSKILVIWDGKHLVLAAKGHFAKQFLGSPFATNTPHTVYRNRMIFGNERQALALLNSETAVAGAMADVRGAIDLFDQHAGETPRDFASIFDQLSKEDQIWLVSRGSLPFADMPTRSDEVSILSNFAGYVSSTSLGMLVENGIDIKARVDCISPAGSRRVYDGLRAGIGLLTLGKKTNKLPWSTLFKTINVRHDKNVVYVSADLSPPHSDNVLDAVTTLIFRPR